MDKVQQRILTVVAGAALLMGAATGSRTTRFYPDDPLWQLPAPLPVKNPANRGLNQLYDFILNTAGPPGEKHPPGAPIVAKDINTIGEVPDDLWFTNRHPRKRMSIEELRQGPWRGNQPAPPFRITGAKTEGITPGFRMADARGRRYLCKPDPFSNPEMATAADVVSSKILYAAGYNVPENYIAYFDRGQISVDPKAKITPAGGKERAMIDVDLRRLLNVIPRDREGRFRVMASFYVEGKGVGYFRWSGTRRDDPNDLYPHEHRRSLRGLHVFASWVNHTDIKAGNTFDTLVDVNGVPVIKHYLIDFGASLGSDSDEPKNARFGHEYMITKEKSVLLKMIGLGLISPEWERVDYPDIKAVGRFSAEAFNPDTWTSNYPNSAFVNRLPDDTFWAAKQVMAFTEPEVRAMVETGEYTDRRAVDSITSTLMARREKIGRTFFAKVLPLEGFQVQDGRLAFEDLAARYAFSPARQYRWEWSSFDNATGQRSPIAGATSAETPRTGEYVVAKITAAGDNAKAVHVFLRGAQVVGIERTW